MHLPRTPFVSLLTTALCINVVACSSEAQPNGPSGSVGDGGLADAPREDTAHPPPPDEASVCVALKTCGRLETWSVSTCAWFLTGARAGVVKADAPPAAYNQVFDCLNGASGCDALLACGWPGALETRDTCNAADPPACVEGVETRCDPTYGTTRYDNCASKGEDCTALPAGGSGCGAGSCADGAAPTCDGDDKVLCSGGVQRKYLCSRQMPGSACADDGTGAFDCRGTGDACTGTVDVTATCDGASVVACVGGREQSLDCSAVPGWTCDMNGGQLWGVHCEPQNQGCTALMFMDRCDAGVLSVCSDGTLRSFDCIVEGYGGCEVTPGGFASCVL